MLKLPSVAAITSQTVNVDLSSRTVDTYPLSLGYGNFLITIDLTNAHFDNSGYDTMIYFVDANDLYGFMLDVNSGTAHFCDAFNTGESIFSYSPMDVNYTMRFLGSGSVYVENLDNGYEMATTTSC